MDDDFDDGVDVDAHCGVDVDGGKANSCSHLVPVSLVVLLYNKHYSSSESTSMGQVLLYVYLVRLIVRAYQVPDILYVRHT